MFLRILWYFLCFLIFLIKWKKIQPLKKGFLDNMYMTQVNDKIYNDIINIRIKNNKDIEVMYLRIGKRMFLPSGLRQVKKFWNGKYCSNEIMIPPNNFTICPKYFQTEVPSFKFYWFGFENSHVLWYFIDLNRKSMFWLVLLWLKYVFI